MSEELRADARRNIRSILEAASRVLADDPTASMQAIAAAAEVSRPTIYRHFANREELIDAIRVEAMTLALEALERAAASAEPAADALARLIGELADVAAHYPLLARLIGSGPPAGKGPKRKDRMIKAFSTLIERGREDGTLRPDLRPETLGPATMGALFLALKLGSVSGVDPHRLGAEVAAIVVDGVRPG
jgi:TetR/AcrR family transcriptional regulator, mexCD-oprJ operon repressor